MSKDEDYGKDISRRQCFPAVVCLQYSTFALDTQKVNARYEKVKKEYKLNHLLFMDDLNLFYKSEERIDTLVTAVHVLKLAWSL